MERWSRTLILFALAALLVEPALWLARTWVEPSYGSDGGVVALLVLGLVGWSVTSGPAPEDPGARRWAWALFGAAALTRLTGRILDISHVGALALVADVAALALYLRLHARPKPVHPAALAGLFALSLPTEQLLQHVLGHPLRMASAIAAEWVLTPLVPGLERTGALLTTPGQTLHVDLPCSGAQGLFLFGALAWFFACIREIGPLRGLAGTAAVLGGALLANALRLAALVLGPTETLLLEPWHSVVGLIAMAIGAIPVLACAATFPQRTPSRPRTRTSTATRPIHPALALTVATAAVAITLVPHRPADVSAPLPDLLLPDRVDDHIGTPLPLTDQEQAYFGKFGGAVERAAFQGPDGSEIAALLVGTTAPVRHLHGADLCLKGAGHTVTRLGIHPAPVPTTIYKTVAPDGTAWQVRSTLVSTDGEVVETPSEVVWRWMADGGAWMRVERVAPWDLCESDPERCDRFDRALLAHLDIPLEER